MMQLKLHVHYSSAEELDPNVTFNDVYDHVGGCMDDVIIFGLQQSFFCNGFGKKQRLKSFC